MNEKLAPRIEHGTAGILFKHELTGTANTLFFHNSQFCNFFASKLSQLQKHN